MAFFFVSASSAGLPFCCHIPSSGLASLTSSSYRYFGLCCKQQTPEGGEGPSRLEESFPFLDTSKQTPSVSRCFCEGFCHALLRDTLQTNLNFPTLLQHITLFSIRLTGQNRFALVGWYLYARWKSFLLSRDVSAQSVYLVWVC